MLLMLLAQAEPAATGNPVQTILEFAFKGGWLMLPIAACSLYALAVVIERWVSLTPGNVAPEAVASQTRATLQRDARAFDQARQVAEKSRTALGRMFAGMLTRMHLTRAQLERFLATAADRESRTMRKHMRGLAVVVAIAPMLGLLGTVFGMIDAFSTVATSGEALGRTELLATGIYEALVTTAAGLLVAIPAMIAYHALSGRIERRAGELNDHLVAFLTDFHREPAATAPPTPREADAASIARTNGDPPPVAEREALSADAK